MLNQLSVIAKSVEIKHLAWRVRVQVRQQHYRNRRGVPFVKTGSFKKLENIQLLQAFICENVSHDLIQSAKPVSCAIGLAFSNTIRPSTRHLEVTMVHWSAQIALRPFPGVLGAPPDNPVSNVSQILSRLLLSALKAPNPHAFSIFAAIITKE